MPLQDDMHLISVDGQLIDMGGAGLEAFRLEDPDQCRVALTAYAGRQV